MAGLVSAATVADITRGLDLAGVGANAVLGANKAREHRFDAFGFAFLAIVSGLGGGMIRDILLARRPGIFEDHTLYATYAAAGSITLVALTEARGAVLDRTPCAGTPLPDHSRVMGPSGSQPSR